MKAGRFLAVVVAFMMVFAVMPVSLEAGEEPAAPDYVWVAGAWNVDGDDNVTDEGFEHLKFGVDAFESIQDAIDAVAPGGIVNVLPGEYDELNNGPDSNVSLYIDKPLTLQGVDSNLDPIEVRWHPEMPVVHCYTQAGPPIRYNILVTADNVTITGLYFHSRGRVLSLGGTNRIRADYVIWVEGSNFKIMNCQVRPRKTDSTIDSFNEYSVVFAGEDARSALVQQNWLEGGVRFIDGAGLGTIVEQNEIYQRVPGAALAIWNVSYGEGFPAVQKNTINIDEPLWSGDIYVVSAYAADDENLPGAEWLFGVIQGNTVNPEVHAILEDLDEFRLRIIPAPESGYVYGYSSIEQALADAGEGDTILSEMQPVDGVTTLVFDPGDMPANSQIILGGNPGIVIPKAALGGTGEHTVTVSWWEEIGDRVLPEGYVFVMGASFNIEDGDGPVGSFVEDNPVEIWINLDGIPVELDPETLALFRYNEVTEEWEVQLKEFDEANNTVIFYTSQWSDFVFMDAEEETPEETPETGTAVMWLIPFGALLLLAGWGLRRRAVA